MRFKVYESDCVEFMRRLEDNTVDAIITDPPYGLEFMQKDFDKIGAGAAMQAWHFAWATEALRVLKPGGHLLAFGGSRTYHRLTCALEDAGFEIRDCIIWQYLSGFPKSLSVSKAIDKAAGGERTGVIGTRHRNVKPFDDSNSWNANNTTGNHEYTAPVTDAAIKWDGWGTALKPSQEPIVVARKPLVGTVAKNVEQWGTGALNIDDCRVGTEKRLLRVVSPRAEGVEYATSTYEGKQDGSLQSSRAAGTTALGRWPPNTVMSHDPACVAIGEAPVRGTGHWPETRGAGSSRAGASGHVGQSDLTEKYEEGVKVVWACVPGCPVRHLDNQTGVRTSGTGAVRRKTAKENDGNTSVCYGAVSQAEGTPMTEHRDTRGGSRCFPCFNWSAELYDPFLPSFYAAKATVSEREAGLTGEGRVNLHPTVKPIGLMRWLVRLVTPPGGIVLDPFTGSGTTGCAAVLGGFDFLGVEKDPTYVEIAVQRIEHWARAV